MKKFNLYYKVTSRESSLKTCNANIDRDIFYDEECTQLAGVMKSIAEELKLNPKNDSTEYTVTNSITTPEFKTIYNYIRDSSNVVKTISVYFTDKSGFSYSNIKIKRVILKNEVRKLTIKLP